MNIVQEVSNKAGGFDALAKIHGVSYQSVWLWHKQGYFPLKQMAKVVETFPEFGAERLIAAYEKNKKDKP